MGKPYGGTSPRGLFLHEFFGCFQKNSVFFPPNHPFFFEGFFGETPFGGV